MNLFNHELVLFRAKFACILVIRDPVFKWELCKGCVWKSLKKTQDMCVQRSLATSKSLKWHTCEACKELNGHDSWSTIRQNVQFGQIVSSWLKLTTCSTRETKSPECPVWMKTNFSHSSHTLLQIPLYPRNVESFQREFWERNPREKQDWLIHNLWHLILQIPLLSPSPLSYPWEVHLSNPYLVIPISVRRYFGAWEAIRRWPIYLVDAMGLLWDSGS